MLQIYTCSFNLILNMSRIQAYDYIRLYVQVLFIFLSNKLEFVHELLNQIILFLYIVKL